MIWKLTFGILISNFIFFYLYSIAEFLCRIFKLNISNINKIIFGYSILIIFLYIIYFSLNFKVTEIYIFLAITFSLFLINIKKYIDNFFLTKENIFANFLIIFFFIPLLIYGEQFYIFRGNYWDSSNYLSSAILFNNYEYQDIVDGLYPNLFLEFQSIDYIIKARPLANLLLALLINKIFSIFFIYYFLKTLLMSLIFLTFIAFLKKFFKFQNKFFSLIISLAFIFSFWNIYIFEIDAISHYASIPILILSISLIFESFDKLNDKKNLYLLTISSSSLFIIYPEIFLVIILTFLVLLFDNIKKINKKVIFNFFVCFVIFFTITLLTYETNYEHLIFSQFNQITRSNDWWGYFGSFVLGKSNLVLNPEFVNEIKITIQDNSKNINILSLIHQEHFNNGYKFIYLNILPSLSGLYFLMPGLIKNNYSYLGQYFFVLVIIIYLLMIIYTNISYLFRNSYFKKKFIYFIILNISLFSYFIYNQSYWPIIKYSTYLFPFLFLFFVINFKKKSINKFYIILVSTFFIYKYSTFNDGIGRYDSFPSIIDIRLKKEVIWDDPNLVKLENCKQISFNENNYIIKAYLNLKLLDLNINNENKHSCRVYLDNKKFIIVYE